MTLSNFLNHPNKNMTSIMYSHVQNKERIIRSICWNKNLKLLPGFLEYNMPTKFNIYTDAPVVV